MRKKKSINTDMLAMKPMSKSQDIYEKNNQ